MRSDKEKALTDVRRECYERFLGGVREQKSVEQRISEIRAKREAAQRIGINKRK